jgi:hypothetical protein
MPTINEYNDDTGYFIRAWTPDTDNITYQVRQSGNAIIEDYGLSDGDDISWETIQSLKAIGKIYTSGNGTFGPSDVEPPDGTAKSLTESEANSLLDAILSKEDISKEEIDRVCGILGIESPESNVEGDLGELLMDRIVDSGIRDRLHTTKTLGDDVSSPAISVGVDENSDQDDGLVFGLKITLFDVSDGDLSLARHEAYIYKEHGLECWYLACSGDVTWEKEAEMNQQKSLLLRSVVDLMKELKIDCGTPTSDFGTWTFEASELLESESIFLD